MKENNLKPLRGHSGYNTIKSMGEENVEWIISHRNVNPSCVSCDVFAVLNPQ